LSATDNELNQPETIMTTPPPSETPPVCDYTDSDYQSTFWDSGERRYEDAAEEIALKRLLPDSGRLLLELGAGAGRNTPRYQGYQRIVLLDYSRTQLLQARQRLGDSDRYVYVAADIYKLPFVAGLFDGATMIRTLHHMAKPELALANIRRVMTEHGVFILEFANKRNLKSVLRFVAGRQEWNPFKPNPVEFVKLNYNFHPKTIRRQLSEAGFKVEKQLAVSHFRAGWLKRNLPHKLLVGLDSLLQPTGAVWQYSPSLFSRTSAVGASPAVPAGAFFRCPICGESLPEQSSTLICSGCGHEWPFVDGIYDFRVDAQG
jgi:ubiquinone/menaquinone biosynthesis C-methylase UbiE